MIDEKLFSEENFENIYREYFYFGSNDELVFGSSHTSSLYNSGNTCVVICPPLGLEYMNTNRTIRYIADYFSLAGFPCLRFDYPDTGDSADVNSKENQVDIWINSIESAIKIIKEKSGLPKIGLVGVGIGGAFAAIVAEKLTLEFLVLLAAPQRGKQYLREIKALQMTSQCESKYELPDILEAGGMVYWPKIESDIKGIDISNLKVKSKRNLVVPKDGTKRNNQWIEIWNKRNNGNIEVIRETTNLESMFFNAHLAEVPHNIIVNIIEWCNSEYLLTIQNLGCNQSKNVNSYLKNQMILKFPKELEINMLKKDYVLTEEPFYFGKNRKCFGIKSTPATSPSNKLPSIILLNSGATHRVSPGRLYVTLSRLLCGLGFTVYRVDMPGIGDSFSVDIADERNEYLEASFNTIGDVIDYIQNTVEAQEFISMGLCSGAYFSFHAALNNSSRKLVESVLINPLIFYKDKDNGTARNFSEWNDMSRAVLNRSSWLKVLRFEIDLFLVLKTLLKRLQLKIKSSCRKLLSYLKLAKSSSCFSNLDKDLVSISDNGVKLTFILSKNDPGYDLLMTSANIMAPKLIKKNSIRIRFVEGADHTFSMFIPRMQAIRQIVSHFEKEYCGITKYKSKFHETENINE